MGMAKRDAVMKKPKDTKGTLLRLLGYMKEFKWIILIVLILSFTSNVLALFGPKLAGEAINEAAAGKGKVNFDKVYFLIL